VLPSSTVVRLPNKLDLVATHQRPRQPTKRRQVFDPLLSFERRGVPLFYLFGCKRAPRLGVRLESRNHSE
jgi:hypothetical protein